MTPFHRNRFLWAITALFAVFAVLKATPLAMHIKTFVPVVSILVPTLFAFIHGSRRIGWKSMWIFFGITFAVSWVMESTSIATGFPFGHYHYTDNLGPKLGTVPLLIMPAYFSMCYVSWNLAHILLDKFDHRADSVQAFAIPLVAAFIMVMWDLCMDPARATMSQAWIWHQGGSYFGVPFVNFMGWLLTVYLIFQLFALLLRKQNTGADPADNGDRNGATWLLNVALYFATFLEFVVAAAFVVDQPVIDPAGVVWRSKALFETTGLVAIFTMGFVSLLGFFKVRQNQSLQQTRSATR